MVWGKRGAFWGGIWGLAFSIWLFWVPGVGLLLVTIPVVIGAVALGIVSALAAMVYSLGIPHNSVLKYAKGDQEGAFVLLFEGTARQIRHAREVVDNERTLASVLNMPIPTTSTVNSVDPRGAAPGARLLR